VVADSMTLAPPLLPVPLWAGLGQPIGNILGNESISAW
jgi:hypothetical protein